MSVEPGRLAFVVVALIVVGWFALGTHLNVRRGHRLLRWLQEGLPRLGDRTTVRWLGSSGLELKVQEARAPFKSAEVFILLEPRDLPVLWWLFRARGRRDLLIIRGELHSPPRAEVEALDRRAWSTRGLERKLQRQGWTPVAVPSGSPLVAYASGKGDTVSQLIPLIELPERATVRIALHRAAPHLEVHWHVGALRDLESRDVFETLYRIAGGGA